MTSEQDGKSLEYLPGSQLLKLQDKARRKHERVPFHPQSMCHIIFQNTDYFLIYDNYGVDHKTFGSSSM